MVINIRGNGGSGKSTIVKRVMERYVRKHPIFIEGRRQPYGYVLYHENDAHRPLFVPGHYEIACGGCDTIKTVDEVYKLVVEHADRGHDVLYEGIMVQDDVTRFLETRRRGYPMAVIQLNTPLAVCIQSIQARRDARGETRPLSTKNTESRDVRVRRNCARLKDAGIDVITTDREGGFETVARFLQLE